MTETKAVIIKSPRSSDDETKDTGTIDEKVKVEISMITRDDIDHGDFLIRVKNVEDLELVKKAVYQYLEKRKVSQIRYAKSKGKKPKNVIMQFDVEALVVDLSE